MDDHINVVLYSKFSTACTKFIELMEKIPNFSSSLICIDHPDIRKQIKNSKKLTIKKVPSILRLYQQTGYVESFEGEKAFTVLNAKYIEHLQKVNEQQSLMQQQTLLQQQSLMQQQQTLLQQQSSQPAVTAVVQQPVQAQQQQPSQPVQQNTSPNSPMVKISQTSLGDLMDLSDIGEGQGELAIQTYHPVSQHPQATTGIVKKDSGGGGNIVSRAMQMQKERDNEASANGPKVPPMM